MILTENERRVFSKPFGHRTQIYKRDISKNAVKTLNCQKLHIFRNGGIISKGRASFQASIYGGQSDLNVDHEYSFT